jgi:glycosyltransferase involved in cell wall biosynthesis
VHYLDLFDSATRDGTRAHQERRLLEHYGLFVTTSRWSAAALHALGVRGAIEVVYPGLDAAFLNAAPPARDARDLTRVLTVANFIPGKGLLELAQHLASLVELPFEWTVAGSAQLDPDYAARFRTQCSEGALAGRVRLIEAAPDAMLALYDASDLLLSGARFETLGMALREAMARALPVLGWDVGGCGESVRDDESGYLVPYGDEAAFSTKLRALIEQPRLRLALGAAARALAAEFPTWEQARARFAEALGSRTR